MSAACRTVKNRKRISCTEDIHDEGKRTRGCDVRDAGGVASPRAHTGGPGNAKPARRSNELSRGCSEVQGRVVRLLRFAELQRVYLRTLRLLERWAAAGCTACPTWRPSRIRGSRGAASRHALAVLDKVVRALELTGHSPIVIKTLDHWPDIGSDLDLFICGHRKRYPPRHAERTESRAAAPELGRSLGPQVEFPDSRTAATG